MAIAINIKYFDPILYVQKLRKAGVTQEIAEVQAQEMENIVSTILNNDSLASKNDLRETELRLQKEIADLRYASLKFTIWTGVGVVVVLGGMLAKGFHWW